MSGEKLKELERGPISEAKPDDAVPQIPPKFITQVKYMLISQEILSEKDERKSSNLRLDEERCRIQGTSGIPHLHLL